MIKIHRILLLQITCLLGYAPIGLASGYSLIVQSVTSMGNAFAGASTEAVDSSTIFFNPAGLSRLKDTQVLLGMHTLLPDTKFKSSGSTGIFGEPLSGGNGGNAIDDAFIPHLYFSSDVTEQLRFGFGLSAPFGFSADYRDDWQGRYHAIHASLETYNLNPALAFAVNDRLSIGAGINIQYVHFRLLKAADFGALLGIPQAADGTLKIKADDWSVGYNLGLLYEPWSGTRLGLAYRSKISHTLRGTANFTVPTAAAIVTAGGLFADSQAQGDLDLPETFSLGILQEITAQWMVMAEVTWTRWNRFKALKVSFSNPLQPDINQAEEWQNTFRYALGSTYQYDRNWTFRTGVAYDETPIPGAQFRGPEIPDNALYWLTMGISYHGFEDFTVDFSYAHIFTQTAKVKLKNSFGHTLNGEYQTDVDIISMQLGYDF